jgi:ribosomal protein S18 acetylase RimI-like enzyme
MGEVRVLAHGDAPAARRLLNRRPIDNILVSSNVRAFGVERTLLGNDLVGYWEEGELVSFYSDGFSLHPVNATPAALDAFSERITLRRCSSIMGVRDEAIGLWRRLCENSFTQWASPREVRDRQMVMAISSDPLVAPHPDVIVAPTRLLETYHAASLAMYTEEVGVAPINPQGSYRTHVASVMMRGMAYCALSSGQVVFKTDVVACAGGVCQIGGVWLTPRLRGRGLSAALVAAVVAHCRRTYPTVTLYVNPYNHQAVACYRTVGFTQVSECATILY